MLSHRQEPAPGVLYLVGTPIGHMGDLSPRAKSLLTNVSAIACEDTRHSGQMLKNIGTKAPLLSFYQHNTTSRLPQLLELLRKIILIYAIPIEVFKVGLYPPLVIIPMF